MVGAMPVNIIPKFCNGLMDNKNGGEDDELAVHVGSRIKCNNEFGTVRYIGIVEKHRHRGLWYGVEWDDCTRGKHDGSVEGIRYFKTSKPGAGSFIRPEKVVPMRTCAEAIRKCYGENEDETVAAHRKTVINEWKREMGAPFIEMVGFEKIHQKQKFDRLLEVSVHDQNVCKAGDVAALCPNIRSLDVSRNQFSNWRDVIQLASQLPHLREFNVSNNRMAIEMDNGEMETLTENAIYFENLEKINISVCDCDWKDVLLLSHLWPNLEELIAAYNRITSIIAPTVTLQKLTTLRLDGNPIFSWAEVLNLGLLPELQVLSLNDCYIEAIRFSDDVKKVDLFESLEVLFLNRNAISDWRSVSELDKLKNLKKLYFLKNPVQNHDDYDTGSQLIIAKIGSLQELNGSTINRELRRGAEYDYLKQYGAEYKLSLLYPAVKESFALEHCRFDELLKKYGIPDDSLLIKRNSSYTLTSQLLTVTLTDETGSKKIQKKFPSTMLVQKLATLAQRLFRKSGSHGVPKLYLVDEQMQGVEIPLDNMMKELSYFSIKDNDTILVRFS